MIKPSNVVFTAKDSLIINSYKITAEGLADYLGNGCEIVLHSLENLDKSVIVIMNGHHSGRKVGAPITDFALSMLSKINEPPYMDYISYFNKNKHNEPLKSTTIAIKGDKNKVIGLLCINFYLNTPLSSVLESFTPHVYPTQDADVSESFVDNVSDLIKESLFQAKEQVYNDYSISSANKNKEIINILNQRGIFKLKDSVTKIATYLGISKNTVYLHLRNIGKK